MEFHEVESRAMTLHLLRVTRAGLAHLRAAWAMRNDLALHYGPLAFGVGYLVTQAPTYLTPPLWLALASAMGGIVVMIFGAVTFGRHDADSCARCTMVRPRMMTRLVQLGEERRWLRLRWQHRQFPVSMVVAILAVLAGVPTSFLVDTPARPLAVFAYTTLVGLAFLWNNAWQIHHRYYRKVCPWCIRRVARLLLQVEARSVGRQIDEKILKRPKPGSDETLDSAAPAQQDDPQPEVHSGQTVSTVTPIYEADADPAAPGTPRPPS